MLAIWIFCLCMSQALGKGANFPAMDNGYPEGPACGNLNLASVVLAQNEENAADESNKSKPGSETDGSEAAADDEKKSSKAKSKQPAPFVPSEKIPGDQAVDFPVDI